jgi:hypothetical protein
MIVHQLSQKSFQAINQVVNRIQNLLINRLCCQVYKSYCHQLANRKSSHPANHVEFRQNSRFCVQLDFQVLNQAGNL